MSSTLAFTAYGRPEPQGSARAFIVGGKARITSANAKMMPFRSEVTRVARYALAQENKPEPLFPKGSAVELTVHFYFAKPESAKKRHWPSVKPDIDKLLRCIGDALTGVAYADDAQVVVVNCSKRYEGVERVFVSVREAVAG